MRAHTSSCVKYVENNNHHNNTLGDIYVHPRNHKLGFVKPCQYFVSSFWISCQILHLPESLVLRHFRPPPPAFSKMSATGTKILCNGINQDGKCLYTIAAEAAQTRRTDYGCEGYASTGLDARTSAFLGKCGRQEMCASGTRVARNVL
jgi:hypothetical protein